MDGQRCAFSHRIRQEMAREQLEGLCRTPQSQCRLRTGKDVSHGRRIGRQAHCQPHSRMPRPHPGGIAVGDLLGSRRGTPRKHADNDQTGHRRSHPPEETIPSECVHEPSTHDDASLNFHKVLDVALSLNLPNSKTEYYFRPLQWLKRISQDAALPDTAS